MAGLKAIRRRIGSVKNTKQITRAMKLVSAAKLRRAQEAAVGGRSFSERLLEVLRVCEANLPVNAGHPLFEPREVRKRLVVFVAGERGLCGAYNANILKAVQSAEIAGSGGVAVTCFPIGKQAGNAVRRFGWQSAGSFAKLGEDVDRWPLHEIAEELTQGYLSGEFDELVVYYTKFQSVMSQIVTREVLLPFARAEAAAAERSGGSGAGERNPYLTRFDPAPEVILGELLPMILAARVRQAGLEARASEHASRMTAMDSATKNADELITKLKLFYNRARQSSITRELIDIIGGTEAIK